MFSLENKNKIGIFGSLLLLFSTFVSQTVYFIQYHFNVDIPYQIYSIIGIIVFVINLIILLAFIKDFFINRNIVELIIGGSFAIHVFIWSIHNIVYPILCQNGICFDWIYTLIKWISVLASIILFALISLKLLKSDGLGRLMGLGGFVYILILLANSIWNFLTIYSSLIIAIITVLYSLFQCVLLVSYFLFVENE